ncbi:MAG: SDR family oxidoreductase [Hyphomonadaceae bacterium]
MSTLNGRTALVTGASSGIGAATASALARAGVHVLAVARRMERLQELAAGQPGIDAFVADLSDPDAAEQVAARAGAVLGRVDILVNNAGLMLLSPFAVTPMDDWRRMLEVNLLGMIALTHAVFPGMQARKSGDIINISSVSGRTAGANSAVYSASKFGMNGFSEGLRREALKTGVRVTVIEPGAVATELREHVAHGPTRAMIVNWAEAMRQLTDNDVANAVLFAASQPPHVSLNEILMRPTDQD